MTPFVGIVEWARRLQLRQIAICTYFVALCVTQYRNEFILTFPLNISQMLLIVVCGILWADGDRLRFPRFALPMLLVLGGVTFGLNMDLVQLPDRMKTIVGVLVFCTSCYTIVRLYKDDLWRFVGIYYRISVVVASFTILQVLVWAATGIVLVEPVLRGQMDDFLKFRPEAFGVLPRAIGIMREPAHLVAFLLPALYLSIQRLFGNRDLRERIVARSALLVVAGYLLTFSLNGYLGLGVVLASATAQKYARQKIRLALVLVVGGAVTLGAGMGIESIRMRLLQLVSFDPQSLDTNNLSTFAFLSNGLVTYRVAVESNGMGFGINSHPVSYDRYIGGFFSAFKIVMRLNNADAASLYFRLLSELGVFGLLGFLLLIFVHRVPSAGLTGQIGTMALLSVVVIAVRDGNYMNLVVWTCLSLLVVCHERVKAESRQDKALGIGVDV